MGVFPGGLVVKNLPANARDAGLIPGLERSLGEGNGNPLQHSCLENRQRSLVGYSPQGCKEQDISQQLNNNNHSKNGIPITTLFSPKSILNIVKRLVFLNHQKFWFHSETLKFHFLVLSQTNILLPKNPCSVPSRLILHACKRIFRSIDQFQTWLLLDGISHGISSKEVYLLP